ncbi:MAG: hypothetical protein CSA58_11525 [Micrococcales bacterium]|nr:MAG: hypothetical protein CSB46_06585 [Micrococcales bacterium]PIE26082.1 MAG: hypothetical protein CSA58_11525 [Micrococcales bacterium]
MAFARGDNARRARSVVITGAIEIGVPGMTYSVYRSAVDRHGSVWAPIDDLAGPCGDRLRTHSQSPLLDMWAWDISDVPQPDRLRAVIHLRGQVRLPRDNEADALVLHWGEDVACFTPKIVIAKVNSLGRGLSTSHVIALNSYRCATADPLAGWEGVWMRHLAQHHQNEVRQLARHHTCLRKEDVVKPLSADEGGLVLRVYRDGEAEDVPVPFAAPVRSSCEAVRATETLLATCGMTQPPDTGMVRELFSRGDNRS